MTPKPSMEGRRQQKTEIPDIYEHDQSMRTMMRVNYDKHCAEFHQIRQYADFVDGIIIVMQVMSKDSHTELNYLTCR